MTFAGEYRLLPKMAESHILYAMQLRAEISKRMGKDLSEAECKQNVKLCHAALKELAKACIFLAEVSSEAASGCRGQNR